MVGLGLLLLPAVPLRGAKVSVPAGTRLYVRLETPISTKTSHLRQEVRARIVRTVAGPEGTLIPLGAEIEGKLEKLIPSSAPTDRAQVRIRFDRLNLPDKASAGFSGPVAEVDNAREKVLPDGTIEGVLASELPGSRLDDAIAKMGSDAGELQKAKERALGKSDTSIDYPAGTDLVLVLDKPLALEATASAVDAPSVSAAISDAVKGLLAEAPQRAAGKDGRPGDPLNLVVVGNAKAIREAFKAAGWSEAEKMTPNSVWETIRAVANQRGYGAAPVSQLYLFGRPEDLAFEKMLNTFLKRHHLRLWRSPVTTPDGREIWLGAATHDTGLDIRPGVVSHAIDPSLDAEREKVGSDLLVSGHVLAELLTTRPNPLSEGLTATGAPWKTDGRLLLLELKTQ